MRMGAGCAALALALAVVAGAPGSLAAGETVHAGAADQTQTGAQTQAVPPQSAQPMTDEERADQLSQQIGKLMVRCVNLLTARDPMSLATCKEQRDLADQYPHKLKQVDRMMAHDEYGIALAAFDHKKEALDEFNQAVALAPRVAKHGSVERGTAYWHRAMILNELGENARAEKDYRTAEENFRLAGKTDSTGQASRKLRKILRQHAALLEKEGKHAEAEKLREEASR